MSTTQPGHMQAGPSLMMTTSGLKSLEETQEEQQINEDLRWAIFQVVCISNCAPNVTCCGSCGYVASVQAVKQQISTVLSCPQLQYCCILPTQHCCIFSKTLSCELSICSCAQHDVLLGSTYRLQGVLLQNRCVVHVTRPADSLTMGTDSGY